MPDLAQYLELDIETVMEGLAAGGARYATSRDAPAGRAGEGDESEPLAETIGDEDDRLRLAETRIARQDRRPPRLLVDAGVATAASSRRPPA